MSSIRIAEFLRAADRGDPMVVLDVRNDEDFATWRIESRRPLRVEHVPYFTVLEDPTGVAARLPRALPVVVVCAHGGSSEMVAGFLRERAIDATSLDGGMVAYGDHLEAVPVPRSPDARGDLEIWQIQRRGRGCLAYVVSSCGEALVIDPPRQPDFFAAFARELGARIVRVLDTHVHADHLSGGLELARRSGARYALGDEPSVERAAFDDTLRADDSAWPASSTRTATATVHESPGHTPGSISVLLGGSHLLSGDTLFVRGVGRPDLGGDGAAWSRDLYRTLHQRLAALDDGIVVLPAHFDRFDEADAGGVIATNLGEVRKTVEYRIPSEQEFVRALSAAAGPVPASYTAMIAANRASATVSAARAREWELGPNRCVAGLPRLGPVSTDPLGER